ncbi:MAG TPA: response regulator transcription factor, partial [Candidatus Acidoferrum sp.]|nr:response regulator transcription factor [Candidatus Acidoferrum sp.]
MKTILVVDDERHIVDLLRLYLEKEGYAVVAAGDGEEALALHARHDPDLVVLDLMLPRIDGFDVCRELRRRGDTPVLMLTARDDDVDKIIGLELGADDYLTKPFNPRELMARIKAILRRVKSEPEGRQDGGAPGGPPGGAPSGMRLHLANLTVDRARREVWVGDQSVKLRAKEFDLLVTLMENKGIVFTREKLLETV